MMKENSKIIIFDLDDTLINTTEFINSIKIKFLKFLQRKNLIRDSTNFNSKFEEVYSNQKHMRQVCIDLAREINNEEEYGQIGKDLYQIYFSSIKSIKKYKDVDKLLKKLKKNNYLYIATFGFEDIQKEKIQKKKLDKYLEKIIFTENKDIGFYIEIKQKLTEKHNIPEIIMVGDSEHSDIIPANKARIITVRVKQGRKGEFEFGNTKANYKINKISELTNIINQIE